MAKLTKDTTVTSVTGETSTGFHFELDRGIEDDMELLENLIEMDKGNVSVMPEVTLSILGKEQKKALYDHCRGENGRVSTMGVLEEIKEILGAINGKKEKN